MRSRRYKVIEARKQERIGMVAHRTMLGSQQEHPLITTMDNVGPYGATEFTVLFCDPHTLGVAAVGQGKPVKINRVAGFQPI